MEQPITNMEKYHTYKALNERLNKAIKNEFWFEACMIEYAIVEDRTSSILAHTEICKNPYSESKKLANKLNAIIYQIGKKHPVISKKADKALYEELLVWKDKRNEIVHRACTRVYDTEEVKTVALLGKELVKRLCNDSGKISRLAEKLKSESDKNNEVK